MKKGRIISAGVLVFPVVLTLSVTVFGEDGEPNGLSGSSYSSSGTTETSGPCPSWFTAIDRNSTDTYKNERLIVELDACQIIEYEV